MTSSILAADPLTIKRGIDAFTTTDNGKSFFDFARNPIPAGFFCNESAAVTGRIVFKGLPIKTGAPGQLRGADTVVERLDDAVFDAQGTAVTRIRFRALSLVSVTPLRTTCGAFHMYVTLADKQRVTTMSIHRTEAGGGSFSAPLAINARITFIPVEPAKDRSPRKLELTRSVVFSTAAIPWSVSGGPGTKKVDFAAFDTDGDLAPDTLLRGTGNFWPGRSPDGIKTKSAGSCTLCQGEICHSNSGEQHCSGPIYACYPYNCP